MHKKEKVSFSTENELCEAFFDTIKDNKDWTVYPETSGFDFLLVHNSGFQIAVEAKLRLNAKVLVQVLPSARYELPKGPDARAVLVDTISDDMAKLAAHLRVTVIRVGKLLYRTNHFTKNFGTEYFSTPILPAAANERRYAWSGDEKWFTWFHEERLDLPEYVPQVKSGVPSPAVLSQWAIKALKVIAWIDRHGTITRKQMRHLKISASFWMDGRVLKKSEEHGHWEPGQCYIREKLVSQHPSAFEEVQRDFDKWAPELA